MTIGGLWQAVTIFIWLFLECDKNDGCGKSNNFDSVTASLFVLNWHTSDLNWDTKPNITNLIMRRTDLSVDNNFELVSPLPPLLQTPNPASKPHMCNAQYALHIVHCATLKVSCSENLTNIAHWQNMSPICHFHTRISSIDIPEVPAGSALLGPLGRSSAPSQLPPQLPPPTPPPSENLSKQ